MWNNSISFYLKSIPITLKIYFQIPWHFLLFYSLNWCTLLPISSNLPIIQRSRPELTRPDVCLTVRAARYFRIGPNFIRFRAHADNNSIGPLSGGQMLFQLLLESNQFVLILVLIAKIKTFKYFFQLLQMIL